MTDLRKVGPTLGLQSVSNEMAPEQRCSIGVQNIELLLNLEWRSNLLLGVELSRMKYSGDFTRDAVWEESDNARGWAKWLEKRKFRHNSSDSFLSDMTAASLIMWSVLYGCFAEENDRRVQLSKLPLPLPTSVSQLRPYASLMVRVSDWQLPELNQPGAPVVAFEMEPPYAAAQPDVMAAWEAAWESIPPEQRIRKGELVPPVERVSRQYLNEREGLKQLKDREDREIDEAKRNAVTINERPSTPERQQTAAAAPKPNRAPVAPRKSEAELGAEKRKYLVQQDARDYRLKLMNLQQSADSLRAFLKNTLAREGTEAYLTELRNLGGGIYSVANDTELLRNAVITLQEVYKLSIEPYTPPDQVSRHEVDPTTTTIDL